MIDNYGNANVSNGIRRINTDLKIYSGITLMINTNKYIKKGRENSTLCRGVSIKLINIYAIESEELGYETSVICIYEKCDSYVVWTLDRYK